MVNKSTVRRFGDLSIGKDPISDFFGHSTQVPQIRTDFTKLIYLSSQDQDLAKVSYLYNRLIESKDGLFSLSDNDLYLKQELDHRIHTDHLFSRIADAFKVSEKHTEEVPTQVTKFSCLREMIRDFTHYCKYRDRLSDYELHKTQLFVEICEVRRLLHIGKTMASICPS